MRRIVAGLFMSLDGVVEASERWGYRYFNEEMTQSIIEGISQSDAVLIGRRTYLEFSEIWPNQSSAIPMSTLLTGAHKYVASWDGGQRLLGVPTVMDRLIQQAVLQVLTPVFDPHFSEMSFGFRPGRSAHMG
jgi:hypothetical protein